jgi:hypothetical protein
MVMKKKSADAEFAFEFGAFPGVLRKSYLFTMQLTVRTDKCNSKYNVPTIRRLEELVKLQRHKNSIEAVTRHVVGIFVDPFCSVVHP